MVNKTIIALTTAIIATLGSTIYLYNGETITDINLTDSRGDDKNICKRGQKPFYNECKDCYKSEYGVFGEGYGYPAYKHWYCALCQKGHRCDGTYQYECRKGEYGSYGECHDCKSNEYGVYDYGNENYRHWYCEKCPRGYKCNGRDKWRSNE